MTTSAHTPATVPASEFDSLERTYRERDAQAVSLAAEVARLRHLLNALGVQCSNCGADFMPKVTLGRREHDFPGRAPDGAEGA